MTFFYNYSSPPLRRPRLVHFFPCDRSWYAPPMMYRPISLPLTFLLLLQAAAFEWRVCDAVSHFYNGQSFFPLTLSSVQLVYAGTINDIPNM